MPGSIEERETFIRDVAFAVKRAGILPSRSKIRAEYRYQ
jgi:hypothetical protein